jgi:hypothetical protein
VKETLALAALVRIGERVSGRVRASLDEVTDPVQASPRFFYVLAE